MKYLNKKFLKDIASLWPQFLSVFIMAMLSIAIFSGMTSVSTGMKETYEDYANETNLADIFVTGNNITREQTLEVNNLSYVNNAKASMVFSVDVTNEDTTSDIYLNTFLNETLEVMNPLLRSGIALSDETNGIWLDEDYANAHNLKANDTILINYLGNTTEVKVVGTVLDAENIYFITSYSETLPDHEAHGYGYISQSYALEIVTSLSFNQLRIDLNTEVSKETAKDDLKNILGNSFYSLNFQDDKASINQVNEEIDQIKRMAMLFSAVFILLSILAMYTTMTRLVSKQIVQIGTLKSLGYANYQLYIHYGLYGFIVTFLGSIAGMVSGLFTVAPLILGVKKATLTLPEWERIIGLDSIFLTIGMILICTLAAILTTRKVVRNSPAETVRGELKKKKTTKKTYKRSKLSYSWLWTIRSLISNPVRFIMGVIAVAGSLVLMVAGIGVKDSLVNSIDKVFEEEYRYEFVGDIRFASSDMIYEAISKDLIQLGNIETASFTYKNDTKDGVVSILEQGDKILLYNEKDNSLINLLDEEAVISNQLANQLGIEVGDELTYIKSTSSLEYKVKITAISSAKMPQGIFIASTKIQDYTPNIIYLESEGYDSASSIPYISNIVSIDKQKQNMDEMIDSVQSIMLILILASFILSVVILYNLGVLSCLERYREYATMKVIGFYEKELRGLVFKESILTLLLGILIGIPASMKFLELYVQVVSMDSMEWTPYISPIHFAIILVCVVAFVILVNLIVCRKIKKVNMVEALKSNE